MTIAENVMKRFLEMLETEGMTGQVDCVIDDESKEMRLFSLTPKGEEFLRQNKRVFESGNVKMN
jgi:predicted transcriptional regulator